MDKKKVKTELLVHDLKNPLAIIDTGINLLLRNSDKYGPLTVRQRRILNRTLRNTKIAMTLINDIMEIGRSKEGIISKKPCRCLDIIRFPFVEIFDLVNAEIAERIGSCENSSELSIELAKENILLIMDDDLWSRELYLDVRKMRQIIRNLLSNAMKFRKETVSVRIRVEDNILNISIEDDGQGINKDYHKKIFDKYFQLGNERDECVRGHGLGLTGSLILVEDMGGKMEIESDEGKGATFTINVPLGET